MNQECNIPEYLYQANITALTKDKSLDPYPKIGNVRTIAVMPAITKCYEATILDLINEKIDGENPLLHPN